MSFWRTPPAITYGDVRRFGGSLGREAASLSPPVATIDDMYVLTATNQTQGSVADDFCHTMAGEMVCFHIVECDRPDCGCRWSWAGMTSRRATTTAEITEWPDLDLADYRDLIVDHWDDQLNVLSLAEDEEFIDETDTFIRTVQRLGQIFGTGTVLRRVEGATVIASPTPISS